MYGDAELRLAPWLEQHPDEFFLATKTHARDGDGARASLQRSLTRMGVDHVDLIQLHNLVEPYEWGVAHAPGGALEALRRARDEGLTRFIGVTGHGLRIAGMHMQSLQRFDYDSVLLPYNFTLLNDRHYRASVEQLLDVCAEHNVAVQTIKSIARRRWSEPRRAEGERRQSWYRFPPTTTSRPTSGLTTCRRCSTAASWTGSDSAVGRGLVSPSGPSRTNGWLRGCRCTPGPRPNPRRDTAPELR